MLVFRLCLAKGWIWAIVRRVVERHRGRIGFKSAAGAVATFFVTCCFRRRERRRAGTTFRDLGDH